MGKCVGSLKIWLKLVLVSTLKIVVLDLVFVKYGGFHHWSSQNEVHDKGRNPPHFKNIKTKTTIFKR